MGSNSAGFTAVQFGGNAQDAAAPRNPLLQVANSTTFCISSGSNFTSNVVGMASEVDSNGTPDAALVHVSDVRAAAVFDTVFGNNTVHSYAGALLLRRVSGKALLHNVTFSFNSALQAGGLTLEHVCLPLIRNSVFQGNSATRGSGGGLLVADSTHPLLCEQVFLDT